MSQVIRRIPSFSDSGKSHLGTLNSAIFMQGEAGSRHSNWPGSYPRCPITSLKLTEPRDCLMQCRQSAVCSKVRLLRNEKSNGKRAAQNGYLPSWRSSAWGLRSPLNFFLLLSCMLIGTLKGSIASDLEEEYVVKHGEVFEFISEPKVTRQGDRVEIDFTVKDFCDATVAIENPEGNIVRHLASGVLGEKAPEPFSRGKREQRIIWDGKDDQGRYIDDKENVCVRVSLGLKPEFERNLLWVPQRRLGSWQGGNSAVSLPVPLLCPTPEGVYVFEGAGVDQLRLFDHDGDYLRTIYPFPANRIGQIDGLSTAKFPQDGSILPRKIGFIQATLLTSGMTGQTDNRSKSMYGAGATAMCVRGRRIALTSQRLNRLAIDGSTGGLKLDGPSVTFDVTMAAQNRRGTTEPVGPLSIAFSPDQKYLYLGGYMYRDFRATGGDYSIKGCLNGVARIEFAKDALPMVFAGEMSPGKEPSTGDAFEDATSVAVDLKGRVYVTDYGNDRIQVFDETGNFLKAIKVFKPVRLDIHPKSGELYVFSWMLDHDWTIGVASKKSEISILPKLYKLRSFEDPTLLGSYDLPLVPESPRMGRNAYSSKFKPWNYWGGLEYTAVLDPYCTPTRVWIVRGTPVNGPSECEYIRVYELRDGKLSKVRDFSESVKSVFKKFTLPEYWRQRLYANPKNGLLYVAEQHTAARQKAFREILEVNPKDGKTRLIQLPFDAEDIAFGPDGLLHMRERTIVARYDIESFREVPFDYGEEREHVTCATDNNARAAKLISGLPIYCGTGWHIGGMTVSVKNNIGISCYVTKGEGTAPVAFRTGERHIINGDSAVGSAENNAGVPQGRVFTPRFYPGRMRFGEVHIFDKHGLVVKEDLIPGIPDMYGIGLDRDNNLYVMASPSRIIGGKRCFNEMTGTLMKLIPGKARILTDSKSEIVPIKLADSQVPRIPPTGIKRSMRFWIEGAEWLYGGVGFCGKNSSYAMGGCACYNSRFNLDYYGRSFAPEVDRCQVAVLDSNGNLILRVGRYGNVDSAGPKSRVPLGGDEVGLFYAPYVATFSDKYLWISDPGNQRISSINLYYHVTKRISLKDIPDQIP